MVWHKESCFSRAKAVSHQVFWSEHPFLLTDPSVFVACSDLCEKNSSIPTPQHETIPDITLLEASHTCLLS